MDIDISEAADINVEVQALNLEGIKQNLLDYVQDKAKIDIDDSVDKAYQSAKSAENYAGAAAQSAIVAGDCASQASASLGNYYTKAEVNTALAGKANVATTLAGYGITDGANTSLSNLNSNGQMIIDSQNGTISNCVLEIPQNIKLSLENNVLTLKAGSILTRTGSTYATVTVTEDKTSTYGNNGKYYIIATADGTLYNWWRFDKTGSGSILPEDGTNYTYFFNITDKKLYLYGENGWYIWRENTQCYPLGIIEVTNGVASFAKDSNGNDIVFNGAGFIGHHAFVYPNVKALIPDGFNDDGSMKSVERINNSLRIIELVISTTQPHMTLNAYLQNTAPATYQGRYVKEVDDVSELPADNYQYYVKNINKVMTGTQGAGYYPGTLFVRYAYDGTTVTDFTIRQPVRTATVEMLNSALGDIETLLAAI